MSRTALVTVLCATLNARDAVTLTLGSFRRYTPEPTRVLVADNGSTDGTRELLGRVDWVELITLEQRRETGPPERSSEQFVDHGTTLDDLAQLVDTEFLLTLDSDVEFRTAGWLTQLLSQATERGLSAIGEYEPGHGNYMPRLAPHLLLIRTSTLRRLDLRFPGLTTIADPDEATRYLNRDSATAFHLTVAEARSYPSARFYSTAAPLFARLRAAGEPWADTPVPIRDAYRHWGHMSWAAGDRHLSRQHARRAAEVSARAAGYDLCSPSPTA